MEAFLAKLGEPVDDVDEEVFDVFSQPLPSQDLGMVDAKADVLELSVAGQDFHVKQSPGMLQSQRAGGTTGAAVWRVSVEAAEWFAQPDNFLFSSGVLNQDSTVLELGAGISGLIPCVLSSRVRRCVVTDQAYVLKSIKENIAANLCNSTRPLQRKSGKGGRREQQQPAKSSTNNIDVVPLDWEEDDICSALSSFNLAGGVDAVFVVDCIFNYALIEPLVQTCKDISNVRRTSHRTSEQPCTETLCVVIQQLRQPEVFEQWIEAFQKSFRVWRVPDEFLCTGMRSGNGFAMHIGILRAGV